MSYSNFSKNKKMDPKKSMNEREFQIEKFTSLDDIDYMTMLSLFFSLFSLIFKVI